MQAEPLAQPAPKPRAGRRGKKQPAEEEAAAEANEASPEPLGGFAAVKLPADSMMPWVWPAGISGSGAAACLARELQPGAGPLAAHSAGSLNTFPTTVDPGVGGIVQTTCQTQRQRRLRLPVPHAAGARQLRQLQRSWRQHAAPGLGVARRRSQCQQKNSLLRATLSQQLHPSQLAAAAHVAGEA